MIHFHYSSKEPLTISIIDRFMYVDTERIALLLESSFEENFDKVITFQVESDLPKDQLKMLETFCENLPYDFKYPRLDWQ